MAIHPALFVSHGAPSLLMEPHPAGDFLSGLAGQMERPAAVVVMTAHWATPAPRLSSAAAPETIHDFSGFAEDLYRMTYPAPGLPALAAEAAGLLRAAGLEADLDPRRGFDHGTWVPLALMFPAADLPVVQLSVQPRRDPAHHWRLGEALRPLRSRGILLLASGSLTHDLSAWWRGAPPGQETADSAGFAAWMADRIEGGATAELLEYRRLAPAAERSHPTDEHLLPLFAAMGAGTPGQPGRRIHASSDRGALRLDAYRFD